MDPFKFDKVEVKKISDFDFAILLLFLLLASLASLLPSPAFAAAGLGVSGTSASRRLSDFQIFRFAPKSPFHLRFDSPFSSIRSITFPRSFVEPFCACRATASALASRSPSESAKNEAVYEKPARPHEFLSKKLKISDFFSFILFELFEKKNPLRLFFRFLFLHLFLVSTSSTLVLATATSLNRSPRWHRARIVPFCEKPHPAPAVLSLLIFRFLFFLFNAILLLLLGVPATP